MTLIVRIKTAKSVLMISDGRMVNDKIILSENSKKIIKHKNSIYGISGFVLNGVYNSENSSYLYKFLDENKNNNEDLIPVMKEWAEHNIKVFKSENKSLLILKSFTNESIKNEVIEIKCKNDLIVENCYNYYNILGNDYSSIEDFLFYRFEQKYYKLFKNCIGNLNFQIDTNISYRYNKSIFIKSIICCFLVSCYEIKKVIVSSEIIENLTIEELNQIGERFFILFSYFNGFGLGLKYYHYFNEILNNGGYVDLEKLKNQLRFTNIDIENSNIGLFSQGVLLRN